MHPTGDQERVGSIPAGSGNILSWRLIMKYFLQSFFLFKNGSCQFLAKECTQVLVNQLEDWACPGKVWRGKLTVLNMTLMGWLGCKTSTQSVNRPYEIYTVCHSVFGSTLFAILFLILNWNPYLHQVDSELEQSTRNWGMRGLMTQRSSCDQFAVAKYDNFLLDIQ